MSFKIISLKGKKQTVGVGSVRSRLTCVKVTEGNKNPYLYSRREIWPRSMTNDGGRLWVEEEQDLRESFHHVHSPQVLDLVTVLSIQQFELL